jgi:hypothetical protein
MLTPGRLHSSLRLTLNVHLHFHCVVIDAVFEPAPAQGVVFHAARDLDANAVARSLSLVNARNDRSSCSASTMNGCGWG